MRSVTSEHVHPMYCSDERSVRKCGAAMLQVSCRVLSGACAAVFLVATLTLVPPAEGQGQTAKQPAGAAQTPAAKPAGAAQAPAAAKPTGAPAAAKPAKAAPATQPKTAEAGKWQPTKPVEFVIMAGKGGGADRIVRNVIETIAKHNLAPVTFTPVNIAGGSGADAMKYLQEKKGDDHLLLFTLNSFYTTPLDRPDLHLDIS